jgi:3D (Asp-Asp-Asp) domain-containing protein
MPPFVPAPGNQGEVYVTSVLGPVGGTNRLLGTTPFTSAGVTNIPLSPAASFSAFKNGTVLVGGTPATGTGTCTISIRKRLVDGTFVAVSSAPSLFGRAQWDHIALDLAAVDLRTMTVATGEALVVTVDNTGGTIVTQPTDLYVSARRAVLR